MDEVLVGVAAAMGGLRREPTPLSLDEVDWRPLQAWKNYFFSLGSSRVDKMVDLHEVTKGKKMLDVAYVKIRTGIHLIDRILSCRIDGKRYRLRLEEIRYMEEEI